MVDWINDKVLELTNASEILSYEIIQELWSGYGKLFRIHLKGGTCDSLVIKHIGANTPASHSKGWGSSFGHQRKLRSYQVEIAWYEQYSSYRNARCYTPKCLMTASYKNEKIIVLEDLDEAGFRVRLQSAAWKEIKPCIEWLAYFHSQFIGKEPKGLWQSGSYWHLETRPDELKALTDLDLQNLAPIIDKLLENVRYRTFVHGDAKLANFCFNESMTQVAGVDFQYIGGGCGMKDLAYLASSVFDGEQLEKYEGMILDTYFSFLHRALDKSPIEAKDVESEWRPLYRIAWVDFIRFLKGWSPVHWKHNPYTERLVENAIKEFL